MWYKLALAPIPLSNPIEGGFWVDDVPIGYGETKRAREWGKLLKTDPKNINTQEKFNQFLSNANFVDNDGKKTYVVRSTSLANPIVGGFWVNEKKKNELGQVITEPVFIEYGKPLGARAWCLLLNTHKITGYDKDSLKNFLTDDRFEYIGDKKFFIPTMLGDAVLISNPISEGFYIDGDFIEQNEKKNISEWSKLLRTDVIRKKKQTLEEFLSDKLIRNEDGDLIYSFNPQSRSILFQNPIPEGFYVNGEPIESDRKMGVDEWNRLLGTTQIKATDKNSLRIFLNQDGKLTEIDGKKIYKSRKEGQYLANPDKEGFWVGKRFIEPGEPISKTDWRILLRTDAPNVKNEESLKDFLSDRRRFDTFNNKRTYVPLKKSFREGLFREKFNNYNHNDITVKAGQYINVIANKTYYLYLDFAFKKDGKILLAVEINGNQHYGFVTFGKKLSYQDWQNGLERDVLKINYCYNNNIPLLIFNHMLSLKEFKTIVNNLHENPHAYDNFIPQPVTDNNVKSTSLEFIRRQIYSHLYPVFNGTITFENDEAKKRYIKDTLILISKLMGVYENGIDKTDYIRAFDTNVDLTSNYNICLAIYNNLYPDYPLDYDEKITYSDLSKPLKIYKEKPPEKQKPKENLIPSEK